MGHDGGGTKSSTKTEDSLFLLQPTRWQIYKVICETPGAYFYKLMNELPKYSEKISSATLIYHLKKLNERNLIDTAKINGKRIFFPRNLRNIDAERAYMLLQNENAKKIFEYVVNHENAFQNEIARELNVHHDTVNHHIRHLVDAGLLVKEKRGKFIYFKIGPIGIKLLNGSLNIMTEEYVRFILEYLSDSCHFPEVISKTPTSLTIRVVCPDEDDIELTITLSEIKLSIIENVKTKNS
ncbi:MAG: winged helix-turn-helix transcriptional regulator [Promethearchaeota archaeon]